MRDTGYFLQKAYFDRLNGQVLLGAKIIPVYDQVPTGAQYPYILLSEQTQETEDNGKACKSYNVTILLDIVTGYADSDGGNKNIHKIGDTVLSLIGQGLTMDSDFQIVSTNIVGSITIREELNGTTIRHKPIRIRHSIHQLTY